MRRSHSAFVAIFVVCLGPTPLRAWEFDIHHTLTMWLAVRAGFSTADALEIARWNQSRDEGAIAPATLAVPASAIFRDVVLSGDVQKYHFPGDVAPPAPPKARIVVANSNAARRALDDAIRSTNPSQELRALGEALHPFQDSWSHQGMPDSPLRPAREYSPELTWAHPATRGGWMRHDADLPSVYPDDAEKTLAATYDALVKFLDHHQHGDSRPPRPGRRSSLWSRTTSHGRASGRRQRGSCKMPG